MVVAPNRQWQLEVHPGDPADNLSVVAIRRCKNGDALGLFILQRDANAFWGEGGNALLIVNQPLSGTERVMLFHPEAEFSFSPSAAPNAINVALYGVVLAHMKKDDRIVSSKISVASWHKTDLLLTLGGSFLSKSGPATHGYCYGFVIDSAVPKILVELTPYELRKKYGVSCSSGD